MTTEEIARGMVPDWMTLHGRETWILGFCVGFGTAEAIQNLSGGTQIEQLEKWIEEELRYQDPAAGEIVEEICEKIKELKQDAIPK
jgi:hypothetical protein